MQQSEASVFVALTLLAKLKSFATTKGISRMPEQNPVEVYQFQFFLKGISPMIWRRLLMTSNSSLSDLHYAIQISMGWGDYHLNKFTIWGKDYGVYHVGGMDFSDNPKKVYLKDFKFRINEKFDYEYNFTDGWEHEIRLEKILPFDPKKTYPLCIGGDSACPPEECGGSESFMEMKDDHSAWAIEAKLIEAIEIYKEDNDREGFQESLEELLYWENCHKFDRRKINSQLQRYFKAPAEEQLSVEEVQDED